MKVPDVNLLLYAVDQGSAHHHPARRWLEDVLSGTEPVGFAWQVLLGFVRIGTNARLLTAPMTAEVATDYVAQWLGRPMSVTLSPTDRHLLLVRDLLRVTGTAGNLVSDAHLAALAVEHGLVVLSADSDFARFPGVRWENPVAPA